MNNVFKKKSIYEKLQVQTKADVYSILLNIKNNELIERAYVFGSFAIDKFNTDSDIDIVFILKDTDLLNINFIERPLIFDELHSLPVKIDLLVYSESEFENIKNEEKNLFWKSVFTSLVQIK